MQLIRGVHPVVTVTIDGGRELQMLVDTGSAASFIAPGLFEEASDAKTVSATSLCFANAVCFGQAVLRPLESTYTLPRRGYYNGLLGHDLLSLTGLTINYRQQTISLAALAGTDGLPEATAHKFRIDKTRRPHADISIGGIRFQDILLDTGSSYTRIKPAMAEMFPSLPAVAFHEVSFTIDGEERTKIMSFDEVCVGDNGCAGPVLVQQARWPAVGGTFFRNFVTSFDYRQNQLILAPYGHGYKPRQSALERVGLQIHTGDAARIVLVRPESPAARAGITTRSRLVSVNGELVSALGYLGLHTLLEDPGQRTFDIELAEPAGVQRQVQIDLGERR